MKYDQIASGIKEILNAVREQRKVSEILTLILQRSCFLANALHGAFVTLEASTGRLIITSTHGPDWTVARQAISLSIGVGRIGKTVETGEPAFGSFSSTPEKPLFTGMKSEMTMPVLVDQKVWGVIHLDSPLPDAFSESLLNMLAVLAEVAAFAIKMKVQAQEKEEAELQKVESARQTVISNVIAGVAHEINNPLTSILSHASLLTLKRGGDSDETSVRAILEEAGRMADIIKNLRFFDSEEVSPKEICGVNEIIRQAVSIKKIQFQNSHIQIITELEPFSPQILASPSQIQQALINLIQNAERAIPVSREKGWIKISASRKGKKVKIVVSDNGSGISPEQQQLIFDPFFSTQPVGQGTGLGLTKAEAIIKEHGGELTLVESSALGTSFSIELPLVLNADTYLATYASNLGGVSTAPPQSLGTVLVVDDESDILLSIMDYLKMQHIETMVALNAESALELLQKLHFDVVLSDLRMPGVDGMQLYHRAIEINPHYKKRFIFMSGDLMRDTNRSFINASGCICLEKPFSLASLLQKLTPYFVKKSV